MASTRTEFVICAGDTLILPRATLTDSDGERIDIRAVNIYFRMVDFFSNDVVIDNATAVKQQTNDDPETWGDVYYNWTVGETDATGLYRAWFVLQEPTSNRTTRFPVRSDLFILIQDTP